MKFESAFLQMKAFKRDKVVLTFESVDEILNCAQFSVVFL